MVSWDVAGSIEVEGRYMACSTNLVMRGLMSWFCCGNPWGPCGSAGHGACGTCNSGSHQCAWPNISSACLGVTDPGACGISIPAHGCGHTFYVTNRCNGSCVAVTVADCGPSVHSFCNQSHCCGSVCGSNRIIDLTASAFSAIGSLSSGVLPCRVDN
jgi:hypothetical protein